MENTNLSSALFAGTHFDRRRFADDFARFQKGAPPLPDAAPPSSEKKRKRKSNAKKIRKQKPSEGAASASKVVEGCSVFKGQEGKKDVDDSVKVEAGKDEDSEVVRRLKEAERETKRAAILRKRFSIHISGQNVPAPLESFEELVSRYGCDSYLVGNLSKLGFQEPTPIQRAVNALLVRRQALARHWLSCSRCL